MASLPLIAEFPASIPSRHRRLLLLPLSQPNYTTPGRALQASTLQISINSNSEL